MERRYNLRPRASGRVQAANTTQHFRPQQYVPPAGVPPSSDVHSLRRALLSAEEDNLKLSSENAALQEVNRKLTNENSCLQRTLGRKLVMAKHNIHRLEKALEAPKAGQDGSKKREETDREKEKEISSLRESLRAQKEETERVQDFWKRECGKAKAAFESELEMVKSECDAQRRADLQQMQTDCQSKVSQLQEQITEQDKVISTIRDELKARTEEQFITSSQLSFRQLELDQSINKCNALDETFKKDLAEREESWKRRQEEMEKLWREKEDALISSLQESLHAQKEETERVRDFWMTESDTTRAAFENEVKMVKSERDAQRSADLQQMQTDCQRKVSQLQEQITEQDEVISTIRDELKARTEEQFITSSQLSLRQLELNQSINKCNALDETFKKELAEREGSWKRRQEEIKSECDAQRSADLQQMQTDCQRKVSQLQEQITEQDKVIRTIRDELKARTEEQFITSSQLSLRQLELDQSINKCNALDETFKKELAEREESWKRRQEEMEKLWQEKEDALMKKASEAEEELKLVIIKNIHLQELALKKKKNKNKNKKQGFWGKKRQKRSSEEEEVTVCSAQAGQEEMKKVKKEKKQGFCSKKKKQNNSEEEAAVCSAQAGQEKERKEKKEKKRGFWSWARRKNSSHSDSEVEECAACPPQAG